MLNITQTGKTKKFNCCTCRNNHSVLTAIFQVNLD